MKTQLHHIEQAVRKQFVWIDDDKTRWFVDPAFNKGVKGIGVTVFVGIATQLGYSLDEVKEYLDIADISNLEVNDKFRIFNSRMREMLQRRVTGNDMFKEDVTWLMNYKTKLALYYLRTMFMREFVPTQSLNH